MRTEGACHPPIDRLRSRPRAVTAELTMRLSQQFHVGLIALIGIVFASVSSTAYADSGRIQITVLKAGWFIGASGGSGTLTFRGRRYPLSIGGLSAGFVFGASETHLIGRVSNIGS